MTSEQEEILHERIQRWNRGECCDCGKPLKRPPYTTNFDLCRCKGRNAWLVIDDATPEGEAARRAILCRLDNGEAMNKDELMFNCPDCGKPLTRPPYSANFDLCRCNGRNSRQGKPLSSKGRPSTFKRRLSKIASAVIPARFRA